MAYPTGMRMKWMDENTDLVFRRGWGIRARAACGRRMMVGWAVVTLEDCGEAHT